MMSNEMRLTILTWSILFSHVFVGLTLGNENVFVINRNRLQFNIRNSMDSFMIPSSKCNRTLPPTGYECEEFQADLNGDKRCSCSCPDDRATFAFHNSRWACLENGDIRVLQDFNNKTFFHDNTNLPRQLWALRTDDFNRLISIEYDSLGISGWQNCAVHLNSSWYLGCNGTRRRSSLYLKKMKELFGFEVFFSSNSYTTGRFAIKVNRGVQNALLLQGKIINLGIRCTRPKNLPYHSCLMFKVFGQQTCPESLPSLETSSTVKPQQTTFTQGPFVTSSTTTAFPSNISITTNIENVTVRLPPSSGRERSTEDSSSVGVIAGISTAASIALFIFIIIGSLVYRRRYSNKTPRARTASIKENKQDIVTMNPQMNSPIPQDGENGYRALRIGAIEQQIYAPSYSVPQRRDAIEEGPNSNVRPNSNVLQTQMYAPLNIPEELNIYGPRNAHELEPVYNVLEQPTPDSEAWLKHGSIFLEQPVYNILEELSTAEGPEGSGNYDTEPLYNVLEGPYGAISSVLQSTAEGTEEPLNQGTEPVYNVLEEPYAVDEEGSSDYAGAISSERSINNAFKEAHSDKQHGANCETESTSDPVYHVLEENTYANT